MDRLVQVEGGVVLLFGGFCACGFLSGSAKKDAGPKNDRSERTALLVVFARVFLDPVAPGLMDWLSACTRKFGEQCFFLPSQSSGLLRDKKQQWHCRRVSGP